MKKILLICFFIFQNMQPMNSGSSVREIELLYKLKEGRLEKSEFLEIVDSIEKQEKFLSKTLLHYAASLKLFKIAEQLIAEGADVNATDVLGNTPIFDAINHEMAELLYKKGAILFITNEYGDTLLHEDAANYLPAMTRWLIEHKLDVNAVNNIGKTPLHLACRKEVAELLITHGAKVDAIDNDGNTPLFEICSSSSDYADIVEFLLSQGANVHFSKDGDGRTPLHQACNFGNQKVAEILLKNGADIHCRTLLNETPLHFAAQGGDKAMVQFLIGCGASIEIMDLLDKKPLDYLKSNS